MEPKKNPKYDIHRKRGMIFNVSLLISLALVITAFRWSVGTRDKSGGQQRNNHLVQEIVDIPIIYEKKNDLPAPEPLVEPTPKPVVESINIIEVGNEKLVEVSSEPIIDQGNSPMTEVPLSSFDLPREAPSTEEFIIVEKMPEPAGGWPAFFKTLQKHIRYPKQAARVGASGKVFVTFVVNEKGELEKLAIEKGIGFGCDEEAMRVIALTKWNAGKQRGRPVKVRMVQPVMFSLGY